LRVSELCDLRWDQVEFGAAVLHVRRLENDIALLALRSIGTGGKVAGSRIHF
jgi:hypothetical protein